MLFGPDRGYMDGENLQYTDMFSAQYDAVVAAISKLGVVGADQMEVVVTEVGWPSGKTKTKTYRFLGSRGGVARDRTAFSFGSRFSGVVIVFCFFLPKNRFCFAPCVRTAGCDCSFIQCRYHLQIGCPFDFNH